MKAVFKKRRLTFISQCQKYLRYVLNDHFVLVLVFMLGFGLVQYSQLLQDFPQNPWPIGLILFGLVLLLLFAGRMATYVEPADQQFLLSKESEIQEIVTIAQRKAFVIWSSFQTIILAFLAPLFFKLGMKLVYFLVFLALLLVIKWFIFLQKARCFRTGNRLNWVALIAKEQDRKQAILTFFSLFTQVKGISTSVKRRAYLDWLLKGFKKSLHTGWLYLYVRAFLRGGDYLLLTLRLVLLASLSLLFLDTVWLSVGLAFLFHYLLLFQLLALRSHYDYQYLTNLYPLDKSLKQQNLRLFLRLLSYLILVIEMIVSLSFIKAISLLLSILLLNELYLPYKVKKMID